MELHPRLCPPRLPGAFRRRQRAARFLRKRHAVARRGPAGANGGAVEFTSAPFILDKLGPAGARQIEYLPFAHDPELHHPLAGGPPCGVSFVGNHSAERARAMAPLLDHDLALWGTRWQTAAGSDR